MGSIAEGLSIYGARGPEIGITGVTELFIYMINMGFTA
jgi:hypothetical protein